MAPSTEPRSKDHCSTDGSGGACLDPWPMPVAPKEPAECVCRCRLVSSGKSFAEGARQGACRGGEVGAIYQEADKFDRGTIEADYEVDGRDIGAIISRHRQLGLRIISTFPTLATIRSSSAMPLQEVIPSGSHSRSFVYVDDFARGLLEVAASYAKADPINIGADEEVTIREVAERISGLVSDIRGTKI